jgi:peptidyl-prolyl cis-trans isomerase C
MLEYMDFVDTELITSIKNIYLIMGGADMLKKLIVFTLTIFTLLFTFACGEKAVEKTTEKAKGTELADVDGETITLEEYSETITKMPLKVRRTITGKEGKQKVLNDMITEKLLYKEALNRGYENNQNVIEQLEKIKRGLILQEYVEVLFNVDMSVSDEAISDYFTEHKDEFDRQEMVKASQIVTYDVNKAKALLSQIKQGKDFAEVAKQSSEDKSSGWKGGDMGFFPKGKMPPEFDEAAFALKKEGDISDIVKTKYGYHIIKLTGKVPFIESTLSPTVQSNIRRKLTQKRKEEIINETVEGLKSKYSITIKEELLDSFDMPKSPGSHGSFMGTKGGTGMH